MAFKSMFLDRPDHGLSGVSVALQPEFGHASMNVHSVTDMTIGRWRRLNDGTEYRQINIKNERGSRVQFNLFRERK